MTSVLEALALSDSPAGPGTSIRIGLLGLGNVGSAFARLAHDERDRLGPRGFTAITAAALVRSVDKPRPAAGCVWTSPPIPMTSSRNRSTLSSRCSAVSSRRCRWSDGRSVGNPGRHCQ